MAEIIDEIILKVKVDADNAKGGVKKVGDEVEQVNTKSEKLTNTFKGMLPALGVAAVVGGLIKIGKASLAAADQQLKTEQKLLIAANGRTKVQKELIKLAGDLQKVTLFGDEASIEASAKLLPLLNGNADAVKQLLPLIQDFAAFSGTDLVSAADLVGKSVGTQTNALGRYGIQIEGAVGSSERLESALSSLNKIAGGQAAAAAKVGLGAWTQFKNVIGDIQETIGFFLIDAFQPLVSGMKTFAESVNDYFQVPLSEKLQEEKIEMNLLAQSILNTNDNQEVRNKLIVELNSKYPQLLKNLDLETLSNKDLVIALKEVNKQYDLKIKKAALEEVLAENAKASTQVFKEIYAASKTATEQLGKFGNTNNENIKAIIANENGLLGLEDQYIALSAILKETNQLGGSYRDGTNLTNVALTDLGTTINKIKSLQEELNKLREQGLITEQDYNSFISNNDLLEEVGAQNGAVFGESFGKAAEEKISEKMKEFLKLSKEEFKNELTQTEPLTDEDVLRFLGLSESQIADVLAKELTRDLDIDASSLRDDINQWFEDNPEQEPIETPIKLTLSDKADIADEFVELASGISSFIDSLGIGEKIQREIDALDELINKQRDTISETEENASQGNAKQLALEENRLEQLQAARDAADEKKAKAERASLLISKAVALAEIGINLAREISTINATYAATPPLAAGLTAKAIAFAALQSAAVIATAIPSFYEGTEDTGNGGRVDSKGGFNAVLHPNERVMNAEQNKAIKKAFGYTPKNDELVEMIKNSKNMGVNSNGVLIGMGDANNAMVLNSKVSELIDINKRMLRALSNNGTNINVDENGFAIRMNKVAERQQILNNL